MALYVTVYMSLMGPEGLRKVNELCYGGAHYLHDSLLETGLFEKAFDKPFLKEFTLKSLVPAERIQDALMLIGVFGAVEVEKGLVNFCVTEKVSKENIDAIMPTTVGNGGNVAIIGNGRTMEDEIKGWFSPYSNVHFIGYRDNPYNYVKNSDYLIQLSDDESWCNSITEAKALGVPVVVTKFLSAKEQVVDAYNGILVDLDCSDYNTVVDRMISLNQELKDNLKTFIYEPEVDKWKEVLK